MLDIRCVSKRFAEPRPHAALLNVSLSIADKEFVLIDGANGSGKTTLLRLIAGLETPGEGDIIDDGVSVFSDRSPAHRGIGFVFQSSGLFSHMNARQNILLALNNNAGNKALSLDEVLERAHVRPQLLDRYPSELSGGEAKCVSFARAIAVRPRLLLVDEPTAGLDEDMCDIILHEIRRAHEDFGCTTVMTSHEKSSKQIADRHVRMHAGRIRSD